MLDCGATAAFQHVPIAFPVMQAEIRVPFAGTKKNGGQWPPFSNQRCLYVQVRLVSTKFWPLELVQLSWLVETIRQLKLTGVWRISEVPLIWTDVAPVMV